MPEEMTQIQSANPQPMPSQEALPSELDITMSDEELQQVIEKAQTPVESEKPAESEQLLAGKFKTPEELQKGLINLLSKIAGTDDLEGLYKALESNLGNLQELQEGEASEGESADWEATLDQYVDAYAQSGELPQELLDKGVDPQLLKMALDARVQYWQNFVKSVVDYAGGEQEYQKILQFIDNNLSKEEASAYAAAIMTQDLHLIQLVIDGVRARMRTTPSLVEGTETAMPSLQIFESVDDALKAIRDPRYGVDPKYTAAVQQRLLASGFDFTELF
jgi:hypothetical protein